MSNTDGEDTQRIEKIRLYGTYDQVLQSLHEAHDDIDKHKQIIRQRNTELASLREQLKQKEEVIRELIPIAEERLRRIVNYDMPDYYKVTSGIKATIEKAKSLTTKDK